MSSARRALFGGEARFPLLPACEHFAGSEKLIQKALAIQEAEPRAFDVTLDLEDGAEAGREQAHAALVAEILAARPEAPPRRGQLGVRIHPVHHPHWRGDVDTVVRRGGPALAYLTVPKVNSAEEVEAVAASVRTAGRALPLHVLIESQLGLEAVWAIAAVPEVQVLDFGLMDFVSDHHGAIPEAAMRSPGQFEHALVRRAKTEIAAAALARGRVPSHNVTTDLRDPSAAGRDAARAREEFGFLRMWSIHPAQIGPILEAMAPDFSQVEAAREILEVAQAKQWGPIAHRGRLHDRASYRFHFELLERAQLAGTLADSGAEALLADE